MTTFVMKPDPTLSVDMIKDHVDPDYKVRVVRQNLGGHIYQMIETSVTGIIIRYNNRSTGQWAAQVLPRHWIFP